MSNSNTVNIQPGSIKLLYIRINQLYKYEFYYSNQLYQQIEWTEFQ